MSNIDAAIDLGHGVASGSLPKVRVMTFANAAGTGTLFNPKRGRAGWPSWPQLDVDRTAFGVIEGPGRPLTNGVAVRTGRQAGVVERCNAC